MPFFAKCAYQVSQCSLTLYIPAGAAQSGYNVLMLFQKYAALPLFDTTVSCMLCGWTPFINTCVHRLSWIHCSVTWETSGNHLIFMHQLCVHVCVSVSDLSVHHLFLCLPNLQNSQRTWNENADNGIHFLSVHLYLPFLCLCFVAVEVVSTCSQVGGDAWREKCEANILLRQVKGTGVCWCYENNGKLVTVVCLADLARLLTRSTVAVAAGLSHTTSRGS